MLVLRVVMLGVGGYFCQVGRGVVRLVPGEVMQGMAGYVRQVGKSVPNLVRRAVAFLQFEDGWDAAGYICLSFGLALMLLGTLAAPDLPALYLLADVPPPISDGLCPPNANEVCDTGCKLRTTLIGCEDNSGSCGQRAANKPQDCVYCGCVLDWNRELYDDWGNLIGYYCICN
jgi:hypothetical protein